MNHHFFASLKLTLLSITLLCVIFPLLLAGAAHFGPGGGKVELLQKNGVPVGAALVGQKFDKPGYFWSRPSAVNYNAAGSAGSNKGPTNPDYLKDVSERTKAFLAAHPYLKTGEVPVEMVTASGSGLDPDISPAAARVQVGRVARERGLNEAAVAQLVENQLEKPKMGWFGQARVNVLKLNLALENLK